MRQGVLVSRVAWMTFVALAACGGDSPNSGGGGTSSGNDGGGGSTSAGGGSTSGVPGSGTSAAACRIFPSDNPWNRDISGAPVNTALMKSIAPGMSQGRGLHPDWGKLTDGYGIPINSGAGTPPVPIAFNTSYGPKETDELACPNGGGPVCYPIPTDAKIEGGSDASGDRHVLFLDTDGAPDHCTLYELWDSHPSAKGWTVGSAALFKLDSNALRTDGFTSADAAGLPIMPGLVRYDEVAAGTITHAIRFTMNQSQNGYIHPATHAAGKDDASLPPMGLRLRLQASFDDSKFSSAGRAVTTAMKKYGVILADNGSDWFIGGESNDAWDPLMDDLLKDLGKVHGGDFEIVDTGPIIPYSDN